MSATKETPTQKRQREHQEFLRRMGFRPELAKENRIPVANSSYVQPTYNSSNSIPTGVAAKKEIDDYKWKRERCESKETIAAIESKRRRVSPAYSKGAYQYITPGTDLTTMGRKV